MRTLLLRHTVLRRSVTVPSLLLLFVLTAALFLPAVLISTLIALRPGGRRRVARIAVFMLVYLATDIAGLLAACWLWLRAGPGTKIDAPRSQQAHYKLLARLLSALYAVGASMFRLHINPPRTVASDSAASPELPPTPGRPLLVLSRHAGPGDSFLLVHALLTLVHRHPRTVLKSVLRFDPFIDVAVGRLPHCFIGPGADGPGADGDGDAATEQITRIASTMGPADALLVFPEGGNFTPRRRLRVIARLHRKGLFRAGVRARRLRNVLPPQPTGVFTAIDATAHADLVFVAHTGLDHLLTARQVWAGIPLTRPVEVTWWTIPVERVPAEREARLRWLDGNWAQIDAWISRSQPAQPTA